MAEKQSEKKKFVLRMDAQTMAALEKWAADEFRSVNAQVEWIITRALQERGRISENPSQDKGNKKPDKV